MNKKWTPHIVAVNALVVFIVLGLACASTPEFKYNFVPDVTLEMLRKNNVSGNRLVVIKGHSHSMLYNDEARKVQNYFITGGMLMRDREGNLTKKEQKSNELTYQGVTDSLEQYRRRFSLAYELSGSTSGDVIALSLPLKQQYLDLFTFTSDTDYFTKKTTYTPVIFPRVKLEKNETFLILGWGTVREVDNFYELGRIQYPQYSTADDFIRLTMPNGSKPFVEGEKALWEKNKNSTNKAINAFTKAIKANPKFVSAYIRRGDVYTEKGDYDKALADFNKALELAPNNPSIYESRGKMYLIKKEYNAAIADLNQAIDIGQSSFTFALRASLYTERGEFEAAISDYTEAISRPGRTDSYLGRGKIYHMLGDYDKALADYKMASPTVSILYERERYYKEREVIDELRKKAEARQPLVTQQ